MDVQRCPECGGRITTNYCDVCMRKVPFRGVGIRRHKDPWDTSSAHREEGGHECVSFDDPRQPEKKKRPVQVSFPRPKQKAKDKPTQKAKIVSVIVALAVSLLPALFGILDEISSAEPEPEYNMEAYVEAGVPQIIPTELYDDGEIQITAGSSGEYYGDYAVSVMIQNDSHRDVTVATDLLSVNSYMANCGLYADVPSGESQQAFLQLDSYDLENAGITEVAEIAFCLNIYDSETYDDIAATELITLKTDIADGFVQTVDDSGWQMHIDENLRMVYQGAEVSSYGDCDLRLYLENLTDENASVTTTLIKVNGEEVSGFLWDILRPGTRTMDSIYIYELEELDITQLSQITEVYLEYTVETYDGDVITDTVYCTTLFNPNDLPASA